MTAIQWTDETWNPVTGCTKVSEGCRNCYAERVSKRTFAGQRVMHGVDERGNTFRPRRFTDVRCHPERLDAPLRWRKPRRVFVNSMSDLFHERVPDEFILDVFRIMHRCPTHTFQVLTKRPQRLARIPRSKTLTEREAFAAMWDLAAVPFPLPNVWLGVSVEDQKTADERIPILLDMPAAVRFVSYEPALGPVDFRRFMPQCTFADIGGQGACHDCDPCLWTAGQGGRLLDWLIVGGESGPKARPCDVAWIRSAVEQCKAAGVPVFVKQLGANVRSRNDELHWIEQAEHIDWRDDERDRGYQGAPVRVLLRDPKGGDPAEWPEDLRVREFPREVTA